jgi:hypothetical protein
MLFKAMPGAATLFLFVILLLDSGTNLKESIAVVIPFLNRNSVSISQSADEPMDSTPNFEKPLRAPGVCLLSPADG